MGKQAFGREATFFTWQWFLFIISLGVIGFLLYRNRQTRKWIAKNKRTVVISSILIGIPIGTLILISSDAGIQWLDLSVLRSKTLHDFFQTSINHTYIPYHDELIVYQHLPRTGGDSMRTHAFNNVSIDFLPIWRSDPDSPPKPFEWNEEIVRNASAVKGYFSKNDIDKLRSFGRPLKVFTFLRHPIERVLSFYDFTGFGEASDYFSYDSSIELFSGENGPSRLEHAISFTYNAMVYQYGDQLHIDYRSLSGEEALERAKRELDKMDFVGFYENLGPDFWHIHKTIFGDTIVPDVYPWAFYLGCIIGSPRFRVAKYTKLVDEKTMERVREVNRLDLELYEYARQKFHQDYSLYNNYIEYSLDNIFTILFWTILTSCIILLLLFSCWKCFGYIKTQYNARNKSISFDSKRV